MPVQFNAAALAVFRNADFADQNTIANLDGAGLKANGRLGGLLSRLFRSSAAKAENNAVREELLRTLGNAFDIDGVDERDGRLTFSREFMERLEGILGRDVLKTSDFKIGADGRVSSGRPLTQRRISAIVSKAMKIGCPFAAEEYEGKLSTVLSQVRRQGNAKLEEHFGSVRRALDFYVNEFDRIVVKNPDYAPGGAGAAGGDENRRAPYLMFDYGENRYVPIERGLDLSFNLARGGARNPAGLVVEVENAFPDRDDRIRDDQGLDRLRKYLANALRAYVQLSVDCYLAARSRDDMDELEDLLSFPARSMDERIRHLSQYAKDRLPPEAIPDPLPESGRTAAGTNAND